MAAKVFLDTNVLIYAVMGGGEDEPKRKLASSLIEAEDFGTSAHVLEACLVTAVRKASHPLSAAEALGAETVYSEDLNDRQRYGSVRVVNPFAERVSRGSRT